MTVAETTAHNPASQATGQFGVWAVLLVWLAAAVTLTQAGAFEAGPDDVPLALMAAAVGPPILFLLLYRVSASLRAWVTRADLGVLTAMQGWRVVGAAFLFLYAFELLPALFAYFGGIGDVLVGLSAPFAVLALTRKSDGWQKKVFWLNVAGMFDFAVAFVTGLGTSGSALGIFAGERTSDLLATLPVALFPVYIVPVFMIMHIMSFIKLRTEM